MVQEELHLAHVVEGRAARRLDVPQQSCRLDNGKTEFFIDNLLVRIHIIMVMIRWTGLAPSTWMYRSSPAIWRTVSDRPGGVPREQKMLTGHLPRVIYHQVY